MEEKRKLFIQKWLVIFGFLVLSGVLAWYALSRNEENFLLKKEKLFQEQIVELQSFQTSLSMMQEWGYPPHTLERDSLFRGYQIQALSVLSSIQKKDTLMEAPDRRLLGTLEGLLVYAGIQQKAVADTPILGLAVRSRMMSITLQLFRNSEANLMFTNKKILVLTHHRSTLLGSLGGIISFLGLAFIFFQRQSAKVVQILEFELSLIEQLIITSHVITDWKDQVRHILRNINTILPMDFLFSVFVTKDSVCEANIFWSGEPSPKVREEVENLIWKRVSKVDGIAVEAPLSIDHNPINGNHDLIGCDLGSLDLSTKTLILETPKIGGIVGVGIRPKKDRDRIRILVVESLLTSILNVLGSVKAIHLYTKEMEYYAVRDPLTSLFNHRVFLEFLEYEIFRNTRHETPCSVMILDLDDFKGVNDTFGHATGDAFLQHVASLIQKSCRNEDISCRYGGDEFAVIFPDADTEQAYTIAQRVRQELIEHPFVRSDQTTVHASMSIGLASFPRHGRTGQDLFHVADHMMYRAKKAGKNTVLAPTYEDLQETSQIASHKKIFILEAVRNRTPIPFFQPIRNLETDEILGFEVLARLPSEETNGFISASDFIEVVEDAGLIASLDYAIMERAFEEKRCNEFDGLLFVNLSPKSLFIPEFLTTVREVVKRAGTNPDQIVFEITERDAIRNLRLMEQFIQNLRGEGFRFAVDDFGAGYASLHYLRIFPIDFVKIDGPFIVGTGEGNPVDMAIVRSIVTLGEEMDICVIGESIESELIRKAAISKKVCFGQGFHLGRPHSMIQT